MTLTIVNALHFPINRPNTLGLPIMDRAFQNSFPDECCFQNQREKFWNLSVPYNVNYVIFFHYCFLSFNVLLTLIKLLIIIRMQGPNFYPNKENNVQNNNRNEIIVNFYAEQNEQMQGNT